MGDSSCHLWEGGGGGLLGHCTGGGWGNQALGLQENSESEGGKKSADELIHPQLTSFSLNRFPLKVLFPVEIAMLPATRARWEKPLPDTQCFRAASSPASAWGKERLVDVGVAPEGERGAAQG